MILRELRSDEAALRGATAIALLPLGAVEQHGRHLPLGTDALIVSAIAARVEARLPDTVILLPTIEIGASDHHLSMPGSVSAGSMVVADTAARVCLSIARSTGISRFLLLNGHGGNQPAVRLALESVRAAHDGSRATESTTGR